MDVPWKIEIFGGLRAVRGDWKVSRFRRTKTASLLAYLAYSLHRSAGTRRDVLVEILWPEAEPEAGRRDLRVALSWLRNQLEPPGVPSGSVILADRDTVQLNPSAVVTDVAAFESAIRDAARAGSNTTERVHRLEEAVALYQGELLHGIYESWVLQPREWLAEQYFQALRKLIGLLQRAGEVSRALEHARQGIRLDPLREDAHCEVMRLLAEAGQPQAALRQYRELERVLKQDLDATPSAAARALARELTRLAEQARLEPPTLPSASLAPQSAHSPAPAAAPLPTGTVTFLLTDIERSTRLWEEHGATMATVIARHDLLLIAAIEQHGGSVLKSRGEGDSFFAVYPRPSQAVAGAAAIQQALLAEPWPAGISLRVRVALHTGEAELRDGDYYGTAVNRCARLRAIGHGGQILLSRATHQLVCEDLSEGMGLRDLGEHRLKDLQRPEQVFQLLHSDLPAAFPPLTSLEAFPNNLPRQLTSFIGREPEMADIQRRLAMTSLLTLTGAGGCGKTRLALQVAVERLGDYPDGVWWVELAALADPALVPQTVAAALGLREEPGRILLDTLTDYLRPRSVLLLLDNCEHLLGACRVLADTLLRACPGLRILATSRQALNVSGEVIWRVPSLGLPDPQQMPPPEEITKFGAIRLFIERATASQPKFQLASQNAPVVAEVCERLDGIPLAIELAAVRVKLLSVEQINRRLHDRFRLLTGGNPLALPRQQTLRATVDWSYELLSERERLLLRRLAVFAGGFTLEAVEAVCADEPSAISRQPSVRKQNPSSPIVDGCTVTADQILDLLGALVDKSLVIVDETAEEARYRLLETIRQYAAEKLQAGPGGEVAALHRRHRYWFLALAEQAEPALRGPEQEFWLERLEREHDNLRVALDWSLESHQAEAGLQLGGALWRFWFVRGHLTEGRQRLEAFLALKAATGDQPSMDPPGGQPSRGTLQTSRAVRAKALRATGALAADQGDREAAQGLLSESLAIGRALGDQREIAASLHHLGSIALYRGDYAAAVTLYEESLTAWRELGDQWGIASLLFNLGSVARYRGDHGTARALHEESLAIQRELGNQRGIARSLTVLGTLAEHLGDYAAVRALYEESLSISRALGDRECIAANLECLGQVAQVQGDYGTARSLCEESLAIRKKLGDKSSIVSSLAALGLLAQEQGESDAARRLHEECLEISRALGDKRSIAWSLDSLGLVAHDRCDYAAAQALYEESLAIRQELGNRHDIASTLYALGRLARDRGNGTAARALLCESLLIRHELGDKRGVAECIENLAGIVAANSGPRRPTEETWEWATRLFGAAEALRDTFGAPRTPPGRADVERSLAELQRRLGEERFAAAWAAGRRMTVEQALAFALEGLDPDRPTV